SHHTATPQTFTLSLHDALPISDKRCCQSGKSCCDTGNDQVVPKIGDIRKRGFGQAGHQHKAGNPDQHGNCQCRHEAFTPGGCFFHSGNDHQCQPGNQYANHQLQVGHGQFVECVNNQPYFVHDTTPSQTAFGHGHIAGLEQTVL